MIACPLALICGLSLSPGGGPLADVLTRQGYTSVEIVEGARTSWWYITATVNEKRVRLIVDTGSSDSIIDTKSGDKAGVIVTPPPGNPNAFAGMAVRVRPTLTVGGITSPSVPFVVTGLFDRIGVQRNNDGVDDCDGIFGSSCLRYYSAVLDYEGRKLYLRDPVEPLRANWRVTEATSNGERLAAGTLGETRIRIAGDKLTYDSPKFRSEYVLTLDPHLSPKQMDWGTDGKSQRLPAIYEIAAGKLRIAAPLFQSKPSTTRPTTFETSPGCGYATLTLEKVK